VLVDGVHYDDALKPLARLKTKKLLILQMYGLSEFKLSCLLENEPFITIIRLVFNLEVEFSKASF